MGATSGREVRNPPTGVCCWNTDFNPDRHPFLLLVPFHKFFRSLDDGKLCVREVYKEDYLRIFNIPSPTTHTHAQGY